MARTALTVTTLTANTAAADVLASAGVAIDATNSHVLTVAHPLDSYIIRINNTTAATKVATIKAGDASPADAAGQGDLAVSCTQDQVKFVGPLESARFIQNDGTLLIDIASAMTGFITVFRVPRG
jgi:hypothetical protein